MDPQIDATGKTTTDGQVEPLRTKTIQVRLFGAFREFAPSGYLSLDVRGDSSVGELKNALAQRLMQKTSSTKFDIAALVAKSALATDSKVLQDSEYFDGNEIAILPPVCGG